MTSLYNYINAAHRHGLNHDHTLFKLMCRQGAQAGHIQPPDAESLFKAYRLGYDSNAIPSAAVLHHPKYGSLSAAQWAKQIEYLKWLLTTHRSN